MTMVGDKVGQYRITDKIGEGGMGAVYIGEHELLGRRAAVKLLLPQYSHNQEIVTRFFNEARATTSVNHPGIVQVFDFGHHTSGSAFIVMELLAGESLDRRLSQGPMDAGQSARIARQAAGALGAAHDLGIVHRDLKPENLFLVPDPDVTGGERVKILDFGIAKLTDDTHPGSVKTRTGSLMGTPTYMAPEQCRGADAVDLRADIYALGCVWFHMVCGRPPFVAEGVGEIIACHLREPAPAVRPLAPQVSPELEAIILRTLAKLPADRFATMGEVIAAIDVATDHAHASAPGLGATALFTDVASVPPVTVTTLGAAAGQTNPSRTISRSRSWLLPLGLITLLAGALAITVLVAGGGGDDGAGQGESEVAATPVRPDPDAGMALADAAHSEPPRRVSIEILSAPSGAEVFDEAGHLVGRTPYRDELAAGDVGKLRFVLSKSGYDDARAEFPSDRGGSSTVELHKHRSSSKPPKRNPPKPDKPDKPEPVDLGSDYDHR